MNPEQFLQSQLVADLYGPESIMERYKNNIVQAFRRNEFDCLPSFLLSIRDKLKTELALSDWVTVKDFMLATGFKESKTRRILRGGIENGEIEAKEEKRPYLYRGCN